MNKPIELNAVTPITAPLPQLKELQRWALRNYFEKLPVHGAAHGFLTARSVLTNALVHADADCVVKLDIKDFFPTITWKRVKGLLRKAGCSEPVQSARRGSSATQSLRPDDDGQSLLSRDDRGRPAERLVNHHNRSPG